MMKNGASPDKVGVLYRMLPIEFHGFTSINDFLGLLGTDHLIFRGAGIFFEKNSLFPNMSEKNKMSSTKLKLKSLLFIQRNFL